MPMTGQPPRRNLRTAAALSKLFSNGDDATQVFVIVRNLNGDHGPKRRLMATPEGPWLAFRRVELAERLSDRAWLESFAPGTLGAAYRRFLEETGYTAAGLAEVSNLEGVALIEHPHALFGRRTRDVHDIWHVLTGDKADETLVEAALVAFSYAQIGGLG
jgi:ubiquinone biosynthesis protein COQ4